MANPKWKEWVEPDGLLRLEAWARDGLTDEQIAHNMGISTMTLRRYKESQCSICEALKRGKEVVDIEVENALLKRALGYKYIEETQELVDGELRVTKKVLKEVSPDTTAQAIWLNNRKPDAWRRNPETKNEAKEMLDRLDEIKEAMEDAAKH